jgi:bacterioferritin (cytochrome b1)
VTREALSSARELIVLISSILLAACAAGTTPPPGSHPYFSIEPREVKYFHALAKKQEGLASKCGESSSCDHVYFTRGLLGLYESREVAEKYFEKVLAVAPKSHLAASSKAWLELLQQPTLPGHRSWLAAVFRAPALAEANTSLALTVDRLVRDLLDREGLIQQLRASKGDDSETVGVLQRELAERDHKIEALLSKKDSAKAPADPTAIQNMQKQLAERDRKIEELSTQLEALKRIDQEMREKVRPIRPPVTTVPVPGPEMTP